MGRKERLMSICCGDIVFLVPVLLFAVIAVDIVLPRLCVNINIQ